MFQRGIQASMEHADRKTLKSNEEPETRKSVQLFYCSLDLNF